MQSITRSHVHYSSPFQSVFILCPVFLSRGMSLMPYAKNLNPLSMRLSSYLCNPGSFEMGVITQGYSDVIYSFLGSSIQLNFLKEKSKIFQCS
jgi:hypothetical protein